MKRKYPHFVLVTKIAAGCVLLVGLPFYFGYGNPLPFLDPDYTFYDNMWLTVFPIMFIGLIIGIKYELIGGAMVVLSVSVAMIATLLVFGSQRFPVHMIIPLLIGILFVIIGLSGTKRKKV